jgi:choline dehydrogenase-like flavoprotein
MTPSMASVLAAPPERLRTRIVVLGAGPGGAITACLLAEAGRDVLLVEDGPFLPLGSCPPFSRREMVQKYRNGGITVALGRNKVAYVEGRCVGGGSEINSGLYHRTPPDVLAEWRRDFQVAELEEEDLRPHFEANEQDVWVSYLPGPAPAASRKLHEGAQRLGWKSLEVPRWFRHDAANPAGSKQSMTRTFIPRFLAAGGALLPHTRARRLRRPGSRWEVQAEHGPDGQGKRLLTIEAETVLVACGAIQTPALLRRSGITRHVGNTLHLHPTVKVVAQFTEEVSAPGMGVPVHQVKEFAPRFSLGCSISTPPHFALALAGHAHRGPDIGRDWRHLAVYYAMIRGGQGRVRQVPFYRDPLVRYHLGEPDRVDLAEGLRKLCECLLAAGATALCPTLAGGPVLHREAELATLPAVLAPGQANLMTIHLFSTCPMGERRDRCATDSFGKVRDVEGLYVADASLLCGPPGVNPQGTIMALVRRNALRFLGRQ